MRSAMAFTAAVTLMCALLTGSAAAQDSNENTAFPWEGEITGMNVYVRSGAGVNWYPVSKLNAGDRAIVLGEKFGWYQIVPPNDCFSYVDKTLVDAAPGATTGTINKDRTYVRAGSLLNSRKSATQLVLDAGAKINIIGEAEGFFKIAPPRGAALYVTKQYIAYVPERLRTGLVERYQAKDHRSPVKQAPAQPMPETVPPAADQSEEDELEPGDVVISPGSVAQPLQPLPTHDITEQPEGVEQDLPIDTEPAVQTPTVRTDDVRSPTAPLETSPAKNESEANDPQLSFAAKRYDKLLTILEKELYAELSKPVDQQNLKPLRARYVEIADQEDEAIPAKIAKIRLRQLQDREAVLTAKADTIEDAEALEKLRAQMTAERMKIMRQRAEEAMVKYDLEGELRRSHVFAPERRRYRLVDPATSQTIAYVDIPAELQINIERFIGRPVGIIAAEKQYSPSAKVPIAVAARIIDLSPRKAATGPTNSADSSNRENTPSVVTNSKLEQPAGDGEKTSERKPPIATAGKPNEPGQE